MKTASSLLLALGIASLLFTLPAAAQMHSSEMVRVSGSIKHMQQIDFEDLMQMTR